MKIDIPNYDERETAGMQITIHKWDTWNMDHTLALIIVPMLKQLKKEKHGVPDVQYEDMPKHLRYKSMRYDPRAIKDLFEESIDWEVELHRQGQCWDWILDEMIWAFTEIVDFNDNEPCIINNKDEYFAYTDRIDNALKLFGKYYRSLWD